MPEAHLLTVRDRHLFARSILGKTVTATPIRSYGGERYVFDFIPFEITTPFETAPGVAEPTVRLFFRDHGTDRDWQRASATIKDYTWEVQDA